MSDKRPFQTLADRLAGRPPDRSLHDGVPEWLAPALSNWLRDALYDEDHAERVVLRLRLVAARTLDFTSTLIMAERSTLLTIVDATLQLHPSWDSVSAVSSSFAGTLRKLDQILVDGGSLYRVDRRSRCLVRRVDATVQKATRATLKRAPEVAADHLRSAWIAAYGLTPDPDKVFNESVRAVEEVACPLIERKRAAQGKATLGTVIGELRNAAHGWELELPGKDGNPRDVESFVAMLETLWQAQISRHGGAPKSRRQSQEEAEAALHLAVLLIQWLTSGVIRRKR